MVELLVSVVILMVGMLGVLQGVNLAIQENLKNELRTKAVSIAEARLAEEKSKPFASISTTTSNSTSTANIRSFAKQFTVVKDTASAGPNTKNIQVGVRWIYKGVAYEQMISTLVSNPDAN